MAPPGHNTTAHPLACSGLGKYTSMRGLSFSSIELSPVGRKYCFCADNVVDTYSIQNNAKCLIIAPKFIKFLTSKYRIISR
jgi:hypothetical protein